MDKKASMADFAALLNQQLKTYHKGFNPGDRAQARVLRVDRGYAALDVQAKNEGLLPLEQVSDDKGTVTVKPGDTLDVVFVGMEKDAFLFSLASAAKPVFDKSITAAYASKMPVEGKVEKEVKGGYEVTVCGQRAFCPFSQIDRFKKEGAEYVGQKLSFLVSECSTDERGANLIVSRRALLDREAAADRERLQASLTEGQTVNGKVTRLMEFGAFVDIGGVEGLVPLRELSWAMHVKPEDVCKVGDDVTVQILSLNWEDNRISLSLKACTPNPWDDAAARFPQGTEFVGKIVRIMPFGAFVSMIPGVDGLIPIGKLGAGRRIATPAEVVKLGDTVRVKVDSVDFERRRFSLRPVTSATPVKPGEKPAAADAEPAINIQDWMAKAKEGEANIGSLAGAFDKLNLK